MLNPRDGNNADLVHARILRARFEKLKKSKEFKAWRIEQYYHVQKKNCAWCREFMPPDFSKLHVDHALALIHGGTNAYSNLVLAHAKCNLKKWIRIDGVPQWIINKRRRYELRLLRQQQADLRHKLAEEAFQERLGWWLRSWIYQS
jgi:5-methylcytosine-specific restriction endonuclease McrA